MLLVHSHRKTAQDDLARAMELDHQRFSHRKALHLAQDFAIVVVALILLALLFHLPWYQLWKQDAAKDCGYFGRAGAHCTVRVPGKEGDGSSPEQNCQSLGRAGRYCAPEPSSH